MQLYQKAIDKETAVIHQVCGSELTEEVEVANKERDELLSLRWKAGEVPTIWTEKTWDVTKTIQGAGTYEVTFT